MRELKFKVWDGQTMSKPFTLSDIYMNYIDPEAGGVVETVVRQYTGLKDKNGVEIYEGDIVRTFEPNEGRLLEEVIFDKGAFKLHCASGDKIDYPVGSLQEKYIEVIDNICENPELLENPPTQEG